MAGDILALAASHAEEIADPALYLNPDIPHYMMAEAGGCLRVFAARRGKELIGYAVFYVRKHPHFTDSIQALQDILYIAPSHRGFGYRFLGWCDEMLKGEGVEFVNHSVTERFDFSPMLMRLGYEPAERIYTRRVS